MGKLLCEKNLRDVWCRNESVRAEIGPILQTHTHTHTHTHASPICVQLRSWVQKVLHIPIKIKVVVFYFKLYKYIV